MWKCFKAITEVSYRLRFSEHCIDLDAPLEFMRGIRAPQLAYLPSDIKDDASTLGKNLLHSWRRERRTEDIQLFGRRKCKSMIYRIPD